MFSLCIAPGVSAQVRPLIHIFLRETAFLMPGEGGDGCTNRSSLDSYGWRAAEGDGAHIGL